MNYNETSKKIIDDIKNFMDKNKYKLCNDIDIMKSLRFMKQCIDNLYTMFPLNDAYRKPLDDMYELFIEMIEKYYEIEIKNNYDKSLQQMLGKLSAEYDKEKGK